jgi:hypothetical protein
MPEEKAEVKGAGVANELKAPVIHRYRNSATPSKTQFGFHGIQSQAIPKAKFAFAGIQNQAKNRRNANCNLAESKPTKWHCNFAGIQSQA